MYECYVKFYSHLLFKLIISHVLDDKNRVAFCAITMEQGSMPRLKTKSAVKKRFRLTASGRIKGNVAYKRHNLRKRPQKMKRQARGTFLLSRGDRALIAQCMPYG